MTILIAIFLFAFSSVIGNYYYGEINIHFGFFLGWGTSAAPAWLKAA